MEKIQLNNRIESVKAIRKDGNIPVVLYNKGFNQTFFIDGKSFHLILEKFNSKIFAIKFELEFNGETHFALIQDMQFHPVTEKVIHIDFKKILPSQKLIVKAKITPTHTERALYQKENGLLYLASRTVKVHCDFDNIISEIFCDVSGLHKGDVLKSSNPIFSSYDFVNSSIILSIVDK